MGDSCCRILTLSVFVFIFLYAFAFSARSEMNAFIAPKMRLDGTFLQLKSEHKQWRSEDWKQLFDYFRAIQLNTLIIQWTVHDEVAFTASGSSGEASGSTLDMLLEEADRNGMQVFVGLVSDSDFWKRIEQPPENVRLYLDDLRKRTLDLATQLLPLVRGRASFKGWYIPEEIDDVNWVGAEARQILLDHMSELCSSLKKWIPGKDIALSGFSNGNLSPASLQALWIELLGRAEVDIVMFQDGVGVHKLSLEMLPSYLEALRQALDMVGRDLYVIIEIFRSTNTRNHREDRFQAVPAAFEHIRQQLKTASPYAENLIAFSVPEYMTPFGGIAAARLFERYQQAITDPK